MPTNHTEYEPRELLAVLLRSRGIRKGIFELTIRSKTQGMSYQSDDNAPFLPAFAIQILSVGFHQVVLHSSHSVDASTIWNEANEEAEEMMGIDEFRLD